MHLYMYEKLDGIYIYKGTKLAIKLIIRWFTFYQTIKLNLMYQCVGGSKMDDSYHIDKQQKVPPPPPTMYFT